ncbi:hypothetical protein BU24DRAFT_451656 [Aaosphaeria arxii CBS 175.79]|uniref:Uncharacterized protein n=1 Tax=Aaosphaeria arxii CBS 175.79 TaxID=1450172 RepID=A0A6A5XPB8_9PLEO|nr:uncharacterized protein BU24DRAFT_451656 [Aaosphaeria arxii CBS 175.79]KAF2014687.1 hypothetical protein BU24DRAFT_451656 [Aaosphaeria arxii CBS 175.79]
MHLVRAGSLLVNCGHGDTDMTLAWANSLDLDQLAVEDEVNSHVYVNIVTPQTYSHGVLRTRNYSGKYNLPFAHAAPKLHVQGSVLHGPRLVQQFPGHESMIQLLAYKLPATGRKIAACGELWRCNHLSSHVSYRLKYRYHRQEISRTGHRRQKEGRSGQNEVGLRNAFDTVLLITANGMTDSLLMHDFWFAIDTTFRSASGSSPGVEMLSVSNQGPVLPPSQFDRTQTEQASEQNLRDVAAEAVP